MKLRRGVISQAVGPDGVENPYTQFYTPWPYYYYYPYMWYWPRTPPAAPARAPLPEAAAVYAPPAPYAGYAALRPWPGGRTYYSGYPTW